MKIYALFDEEGRPKGFYPTDIHPTPPLGAVEISVDDWQEFLDYQGVRRWDGFKVVECPQQAGLPIPPEMIPILENIKNETIEMNNAICGVIRAWSSLENAAAHLMGSIVNQGGGSLGMALYFTPSATETRFQLLNESIVQFAKQDSRGEIVIGLWDRLFKRMRENKLMRNKVAHGDIVTVNQGDRHYVRLTNGIFDFSSSNKDQQRMIKNAINTITKSGAPQLPGMSHSDVSKAADMIVLTQNGCNKMRLVINHMQRTAPDPAAFDKKIQELERCLQAQ
jgi:hypothetical protein